MKQIKPLDKLQTAPCLSQTSFQMITANFARAWNFCNAFNVLTTVPLKPGWLRVCAESPSNMLTVQLLVNNTKCFLWALGKHSKAQHLRCPNRNVTLSSLLRMKSRSENGQFYPSIGECSPSVPSSIRGTRLTPLEGQVFLCGPHLLKDGLPWSWSCPTPAYLGLYLTSLPLCMDGTPDTLELAEWTVPIMGLSRPALLAGAFYIYSLVSHDPEKTSGGFGRERERTVAVLCFGIILLF